MVVAVSLDGDEVMALYDRHARELTGFFARRTGDPQLALDLLADTFVAALQARGNCRAREDSERAGWLYRIAANRLSDHYRQGTSERRALSRIAHQMRPLSGEEYERIETLAASEHLHAHLNTALSELTAEQELAIRLRVLEERSYAEVARDLGVSEQAARARVSRGLRALRRAIDPLRRQA